jgi:single-strand DNA-binding protein
MSDLNRVFLLGNLGNDPELKKSVHGKPYLNLSIATHTFYQGREDKTTHWHRVVVFGAQAEACARHLHKGSQVLLEGSLEVNDYTDREGRKSSRVSVVAHRVQFLSGRLSANVVNAGSDEVSEAAGDNVAESVATGAVAAEEGLAAAAA